MLSTHPKRTVVIHVRMTQTEKDAIVTRATRAGKSVSEYVRGAAMHYVGAAQFANPTTPPRVPSKFLGASDGRGGA